MPTPTPTSEPGETATPSPTPTDTPTSEQAVVSFTLVNADTDEDLQPLQTGDVINLAALPSRNLNVRANTNPAVVGSVRFGLNDNNNLRIEDVPPYALFGDNQSNYAAWTPEVRQQTITATPHSGKNATGLEGTDLSITFTVVDQADEPTPTPTGQPFPTPTPGGAFPRIYLPMILSEGESKTTATYEADESDFLNPERGFHGNADILDETDLSWIRDEGHSLARTYIRLDDYRDRPLPDSFVDQVRNSLANARTAGIKVVLRFSYNFGIGEADAPLSRVEQHIQQLQPILEEYQDVIVVLQAGFIGAWGEWHSSTNGLDTPANKTSVLAALLEALPESRIVQLRYPGDLIDNFPQPLTAADAYSGSDKARTGHHNDCFLSSADDVGTYWPPEREDEFKDYLAQMTAYTPTGGETCQVTPAEHRTDCPTAIAEMARFHWSYLNQDFYRPDIDRWRAEGCYDEISKRLGYRYQMLSASVDRRAQAGELLSLQIRLTNSGFARLYNARPAELILRQAATGAERKVVIQDDARLWLPGPAETKTLSAAVTLPGDLPAGDYDLLLNLPDSVSNLSGLPEYSIRLANQGVWEANTGYNDLGLRVVIN
jgi:hypothetical protein